MAYTIHDDPAIETRIGTDLDHAVQVILAHDAAAVSIVLTGGFARGEGAVLHGTPQNDYDLVVIRHARPPRTSYAALRARLEADLDIHIDLAPVAQPRLRWVAHSIFWYETALRGRTLWGPDLLNRIPVRTPEQIDPSEPLRLLTNRAAGLLLHHDADDPTRRLQAAKALLGALDARLLLSGRFAPTQRERWQLSEALRGDRTFPRAWATWAYHAKLDPGAAARVDADEAWHAAAVAVDDTVPAALRAAGADSIDDAADLDGLVDVVYYARHRPALPRTRRLVRHPTGHVRAATLLLLEAHLGRADAARPLPHLSRFVHGPVEPVAALRALRGATLQ